MHHSTQTHRLLDLLELKHPLIQAPMAGVSTPQLAAAVASTGAMGSLGMGASSASGLEKTLKKLTSLTNRPVNLNFFTHAAPVRDQAKEEAWLSKLQPLFSGLDAEPPSTLKNPYASFDDDPQLLDILLAHQAPVVSFHFGLPKPAAMRALQQQGTRVLSSATSVKEALWLESQGVDAVIAQGWEAGGHRGQFLDDASHDEQLGLSALLPQICAAVAVPVIAAGGINTGASVNAALLLGAAGAQIGTAFVSCPESSAAAPYRAALQQPRNTVMTPVFSGRNAAPAARNPSRRTSRPCGQVRVFAAIGCCRPQSWWS